MEKKIKLSRIIGGREGFEITAESGKFQLTFAEMAKYVGQPLADGNQISIKTKDEGFAELAIEKMVLNVPEYFLLEKGLL